jgi:signal transduction histidine kinase
VKNTILVVLIVASALLVAIIGLTGAVAVQRANRINEQIIESNKKFHDTGRNLQGLRADFDTARIYVRDYMLDPVAESAEIKRGQFREIRTSIERKLTALAGLLPGDEANAVEELRKELDGYFESMSQILEADPRSFPGGISAIRKQLTVRREAIVEVALRIEDIDARRFARESDEIEKVKQDLTLNLWQMTAAGVSLGIVIAFISGKRIFMLQRRSESHRKRIEKSEAERRRLAAELVRAQEEERKHISRELHDEVGQTLTALGIEIANIQRLRYDSGSEFDEHVGEAKELAHSTLKTVRQIAMGLRPSMLDDSGLLPALKWQIREFSKRTNVPVDLKADGVLDQVNEPVSTCVYRVVQEALTNCARHACAQAVRVTLHGDNDRIHLAIQDDGIGFDVSDETDGLGLVGIKERVRDLGGSMKITSALKRGTLILADIPLGVHT